MNVRLNELEADERVMGINEESNGSNARNIHFPHDNSHDDVPGYGTCSRCKKNFIQHGPKLYRTCAHCRELQRQRSRRWQMRTKAKDGVCTRCGSEIPEDQNQFVLCPSCRMQLRSRKAARGLQGRCVHCSAVLDEGRSKFKVCSRCRENDRNRRRHLEDSGLCIRCGKTLATESGKFKVCELCRERRNNPNLLPNARIPNILNAAYRQELLRHQNNANATNASAATNGANSSTNEDDMLRDSHLIIPNYDSDTVSATAAAVLTLDDHNLLENNYFSVEKQN